MSTWFLRHVTWSVCLVRCHFSQPQMRVWNSYQKCVCEINNVQVYLVVGTVNFFPKCVSEMKWTTCKFTRWQVRWTYFPNACVKLCLCTNVIQQHSMEATQPVELQIRVNPVAVAVVIKCPRITTTATEFIWLKSSWSCNDSTQLQLQSSSHRTYHRANLNVVDFTHAFVKNVHRNLHVVYFISHTHFRKMFPVPATG